MILLPHGCSCSEPSVNPKNWKTGGNSLLKKNWRIQYYFRDPKFKEKFPYGKLIPVKGMNRFKTIEERREATQTLLDEELYMLKMEGYNPITGTMNGPDIELEFEIDPNTLFCVAIESAFNNIEVAESTKKGIKTAKNYFIESIKQLRYDSLRIKDVKRKHVRMVLENQSKHNSYSNKRFNKIRAYMQMIFKELLLSEAIEYNPVDNIPLKKEVKEIKETLTEKELKLIKSHLKNNYYTFYRYVEIFFHSGSRSSELMNVKKKDVDIVQQLFKITVKKGRHYVEEYRAINKNALKFWEELLHDAAPNDYLFSKFLKPGPVKIDEWQISKRWREHVKIKLGIDKDFYALKHLHTTKVIDLYDNKYLAAGINGHKSIKMNENHYDIKHNERLLDKAKKINISL